MIWRLAITGMLFQQQSKLTRLQTRPNRHYRTEWRREIDLIENHRQSPGTISRLNPIRNERPIRLL